MGRAERAVRTEGPSATLSREDEDDLIWFLGQIVFHRSTLGPQLERAAMLAVNSDGKRHRPSPLWERGADGRKVGQRQRVYCKETRASDGGYEPEHQDLVRYSRIGTRLEAVARASPQAHVVLTLYFGNAGRRWLHHWARQGYGPGALNCLFEFTPSGRRRLEEMAEERRTEGQPVSPLQPAEQLASEWQSQRLQPTDDRKRLLQRIHDQAEALFDEARRVWNGAGRHGLDR
jgi:hypothetical protein